MGSLKTYRLIPTEDDPILGEIRYTHDPLSLTTEAIIWNGKAWLHLIEPEKDQLIGYRKWA